MPSPNSVERQGVSFEPLADASSPQEYWTAALAAVEEASRRVPSDDWEEIERLVKLENYIRRCLELDGHTPQELDPWQAPPEAE